MAGGIIQKIVQIIFVTNKRPVVAGTTLTYTCNDLLWVFIIEPVRHTSILFAGSKQLMLTLDQTQVHEHVAK